ncbi:hypothetical protein JCM11491_003173 [Sporobolomyces phaffii]
MTRSITTDKATLLSALAQELRSEKQRAEAAAREMVHYEHLIEDQHAAFLAEQDRLQRRRDTNNREIASLRRKLAALKRELDQAQLVKEEDAQLYLDLLHGDGPPRSDSAPPTSPWMSDSRHPSRLVESTLSAQATDPQVASATRDSSSRPTPPELADVQPLGPLDAPPGLRRGSDDWIYRDPRSAKGFHWAGKVLTSFTKRRDSSGATSPSRFQQSQDQ